MKHISTKELNYINDFLSWELLSTKKCYQYGDQETNPSHKEAFFAAAMIHQRNYQNILDYVNEYNNTMLGGPIS